MVLAFLWCSRLSRLMVIAFCGFRRFPNFRVFSVFACSWFSPLSRFWLFRVFKVLIVFALRIHAVHQIRILCRGHVSWQIQLSSKLYCVHFAWKWFRTKKAFLELRTMIIIHLGALRSKGDRTSGLFPTGVFCSPVVGYLIFGTYGFVLKRWAYTYEPVYCLEGLN